MRVREALRYGITQLKNTSDSAPLDAEILLLQALPNSNLTRIWLNNNLDSIIEPDKLEHYKNYIHRRRQLEPVEHITGKKFFYGLDFAVTPNVLIPRPESEMLVNEALELIDNDPDKKYFIADVGTGSGALIISLARQLLNNYKENNHELIGTDISKDALETAKANSRKHRTDHIITFVAGEFLAPLLPNLKSNGRSMLILANLPYLEEKEYAANLALQYEPKSALVSGDNGLKHYKILFEQLAEQARPFILLIEHHPQQTSRLHEIISQKFPVSQITTKPDLSGRDRLTVIKNG